MAARKGADSEVARLLPPSTADNDCPDGSWGPPPSSGSGPAAVKEDGFVTSFYVVLYSVICGVIAFPFMLGYWCWPKMLGWVCTDTALWLCHSMQFAAMLTLLSNLIQYYIYLGSYRHYNYHLSRYGPAYCVLFASIFLMVHPTAFLLKDLNIIGKLCANPEGLWMLYGCTYLGFLLLMYAALWGTDALVLLCGGRGATSERSLPL